MIALIWLLACERPSESTEPAPDTGEAIDTDVAEVVPFAEPAEAVDLDPAPDVVHVSLVAAPFPWTIGDETVEGYAYNGQVPGPTIRAEVGDTLVVDLMNELPEPTTIHWHGVAVPWAMDGVTWMQDPVQPGGSFRYTFTLDVAGTFWYHPHFNSSGQVDRGLYAALVVTDPADPVPDEDVVLVFDAGVEHVEHEDGGDEHEHGLGSLPVPWMVNGLVSPTWSLPAGTSVRARVVNASNTGYLDLRWPEPRHIAGDQGVLAALAEPIAGLVLGPGDRADLEWLVGSEPFTVSSAPYSLSGGPAVGDPLDAIEIAPLGQGAAPAPLAWPFSGASPSEDPPYTDITWVFQGDGDAWFINGEQFPDVTLEELSWGDQAVIEIRNLSSTEHPFHLHGYAFEVLSINGVQPSVQRMEDTVNVPIRSTVRLRLVADNPGDWMAHCHILPHAHDGMMTVLRVAEP